MFGPGDETPFDAEEWTRALRTVLRRSRRSRPSLLQGLTLFEGLLKEASRLLRRYDRHPSVSPDVVLKILARRLRSPDRSGRLADGSR